MLSDSSLWNSPAELAEAVAKIQVDNDIRGTANYFNRVTHAFPVMEVLLSLNNRVNQLEKEIKKLKREGGKK